MKKFLFRSTIFIALSFLAQYVFYIAVKTTLDKKSQFRLTRYFRSPEHKFFVVGNSRAVNSVNEKYARQQLRMDLINLSFNGEPYKNVLNMVDDINSKNKNSTIFFEISCLSNTNFDDEYAYYIPNSPIIGKEFSGTPYDWLPMLRLNNELFLRNIYYLNKSDNDWVNRNTISINIINHIKADSLYTIFPDKKVLADRLAEVQKRCDENGIRLIFFLAPYYPAYRYKIADYDSTIAYMGSMANKYRFIDLNKIKLSNEMYADRVHTNYKGSELLTLNLINLSRN